MKRTLTSMFLLLATALPFFSLAQDKPIINATVSGKVVDARSNEFLIGATISCDLAEAL